MRAFKANLAILSMLLFSLQTFAGDSDLTVRSIMVKQYSRVLNKAYDSSVKSYKELINKPSSFLAKLDKKDAEYLTKVMKHYKVTKFPTIKRSGNGHTLTMSGNKIRISPTFIIDQKITFNGKVFKFSKKETIQENSKRLQGFMGAKKTTSVMSFFIEEANAFICGGFCVGGLVLGTLALGALAIKAAKNVLAGDTGDMEDFRKGIKQKTAQCDTDLNNVETHSSYYTDWSKAPGAFETFSNMRKVADQLQSYNDEKSGSEAKVQEQLYKDYGIDNMKNCGDFAKEFHRKTGAFQKRDQAIDDIMSGKSSKDHKNAICAEINEYIDCLSEFSKIHKGHVKQGEDYKDDIGVYFESDAHEKTLDK